MNRRRFVQSAGMAAALPLALAQRSAHADQPTASTAKAGRVLPAGQDISGVPRTLGFSNIAFKVSTKETAGNLFVLQHTNMTPGGPSLHLHVAQEEWFFVEEGEVLVQMGEKQITLKPGDSALVPRNTPHTFTAVKSPAKMTIAFAPAGNMEQYFLDMATPNPVHRDPAFYGTKVLGPPLKTT